MSSLQVPVVLNTMLNNHTPHVLNIVHVLTRYKNLHFWPQSWIRCTREQNVTQ